MRCLLSIGLAVMPLFVSANPVPPTGVLQSAQSLGESRLEWPLEKIGTLLVLNPFGSVEVVGNADSEGLVLEVIDPANGRKLLVTLQERQPGEFEVVLTNPDGSAPQDGQLPRHPVELRLKVPQTKVLHLGIKANGKITVTGLTLVPGGHDKRVLRVEQFGIAPVVIDSVSNSILRLPKNKVEIKGGCPNTIRDLSAARFAREDWYR